MKTLIDIILFIFLGYGGNQDLVFQSEESKTVDGGPVFNKVNWFSFEDKDIWMMNQSHHGISAENSKWDRLAILIDKTKNPKTATFYQLEPGPLKWSIGIKQVPYRVRCFMCHVNGPRAIRPVESKDRLQIALWNFRIKSYGRIVLHPDSENLKFFGKTDSEKLKVETCLRCHKESGLIARGELSRQNAITIKFMISSGYMPPLGMSLSKSELQAINNFLLGF